MAGDLRRPEIAVTPSLAQAAPVGTARFEGVPYALLCVMEPARLDALPFGVVGLNPDGIVEIYNRTEAHLAGLNRDDVLGTHFFLSVAQCMNNFLVAQRLEDEDEVDAIVAYVLTFRMRPTPVRLRLLKRAGHARRFVLIQR